MKKLKNCKTACILFLSPDNILKLQVQTELFKAESKLNFKSVFFVVRSFRLVSILMPGNMFVVAQWLECAELLRCVTGSTIRIMPNIYIYIFITPWQRSCWRKMLLA